MVQRNLFNKNTKLVIQSIIDWEIFLDELQPMYKYKQAKVR